MKGAVEPGTGSIRPGNPWPAAILFDLDGTLVDTAPDIAAAVNRVMDDLGRSRYPIAQVLQWVGDGAPRLVKRALTGSVNGEPPAGELERAMALFMEHYTAAVCERSAPYPHARNLLEGLRAEGLRVGCVTNKPEKLSKLLLEALQMSALFDLLIGGDTLGVKKPDPEPIHHACRELGVAVADTVYVGDSMTDCEAAAAAGMTMVAVSYGYNRGADLTRAPVAAMIDSLEEIPEVLASIRDREQRGEQAARQPLT